MIPSIKKVYPTIDDCIRDYKKNHHEHDKLLNLWKKYPEVSQRWYFTYNEFLDVARRKSPRPNKYYQENTENDVVVITKLWLSDSISESAKVRVLTSLSWVSVPAASALLMFHNPRQYWVIDIRLRQMLYEYWFVSTKKSWTSLSVTNWVQFLDVMRKLANHHKLPVRKVESILFQVHTEFQEWLLYKK